MSSGASRRGRHPYSRPPPPNDPDGQWVHDMAPGATEERKPRANPSNTDEEPTRLSVSNLHYEVTEKDLVSIFGSIGTLQREPTIRYDRSGRSTGVATVVFTHARDARNAQKQLDGVMAKGEAMSIKLESTPARSQAPKRNPNTNTLLSRMGKKSLADRMSADASENMDSKKGDKQTGPIRHGRSGKGDTKPTRVKAAPKTVEELDKELEAFMGEGDSKAEKGKGEDVAMA